MHSAYIVIHSLLAVSLMIAGSIAPAQAPTPAAPAKPDTPAVTQHIDLARKAAGTEWRAAVDFICKVNPDRANRVDDPLIPPTKLFDNVYAIGRIGTVVYAITTSAGIVLIDAGYSDQLDTVLLPGLKTLGLDPNNVRYVLLGHGHGDHFGGAAYFQDRGARVVLSTADWDLMEAPVTGRAGTPPAPPGPRPPKRDVVAVDGQPIVVGDVTFTPVLIPGHTPGSLGYIFPVKAGSRTHMAALFGGSILIPGRIPDEGLQQYIRSVEHFADVTRKMSVDVELQNHPLLRRLRGKAGASQSRQDRSVSPVRRRGAGVSAVPYGYDRVHPRPTRAAETVMPNTTIYSRTPANRRLHPSYRHEESTKWWEFRYSHALSVHKRAKIPGIRVGA